MLTRLKLIGAALLVALLFIACTVAVVQTQRLETARQDLAQAQALSKSLKGENDALRASSALKASLEKARTEKANTAKEKLDDAIKRTPGWADTPAPDAVTDSLCSLIPCTQAGRSAAR